MTYPKSTSNQTGAMNHVSPTWETDKLGYLLDALRLKFPAGSEMAAKLVATYPHPLLEDNTAGLTAERKRNADKFFGWHEGEGQNYHGRCLVQVRYELRDK